MKVPRHDLNAITLPEITTQHTPAASPRLRLRHAAAVVALAALFVVFTPARAQAQNCDNILPSGGDDAPAINNCLANAGHATLGAGTFYIYQPINILAPNRALIGQGKTLTFITPQFSCAAAGPIIDVNGQNSRDVSNAVIRNFYLDLTYVAPGCATGGPSVRFIRARGGEISGTVISGVVGAGGGDMSAVTLIKSSNILISNNKFKDMGSGIAVEDSPAAIVDNNKVSHTGFEIIVRNNAGADSGGLFDSSNTRVTNNTLTDAQGRAAKFQSSDTGSLPLRNLLVTGNYATGFTATGLYLVANVQNSRFDNNTFIGAPSSYYGLWVGSINSGQSNPGLNPSFNNQINFNTFQGGSNGADVSFNGNANVSGPDQPTISRGSAGNNTLLRGSIEQTPSSGRCAQYAHAWFIYPGGANYLPANGAYLTFAAAGTRTGSNITYHFRKNGVEYATRTTVGGTQSNCVLNQEATFLNLAPGLYDVYIDLRDGNARYPDPNNGPGVPINNWLLDLKLDVR